MTNYKYQGYDQDWNYVSGFIESPSRIEALRTIKNEYNLKAITYFKQSSNSFQNIKTKLEEQNAKLKNKAIQKQRNAEQIKSEKIQAKKDATANRKEKLSKLRELLKPSLLKTNSLTTSQTQEQTPVVNIFYDPNLALQMDTRGDFSAEEAYEKIISKEEITKPQIKSKTSIKRERASEKQIDWDLIERSNRGYDVKKNMKLKVNEKEVVLFTRRLSMMIASGVSLTRSLSILSDHPNKDMRLIINNIIEDLQAGFSFSFAISKYPKQFDNMYIAMVSIGETSGSFSKCLDDIVSYKEKNMGVKKKLKTATIYPSIIGILLIAVLILCSTYLIPTFEKLFQEQEMELPQFTKVVFAITNKIPLFVIVMIVAVIILSITRKNNRAVDRTYRSIVDKILLKIPIIKNVLNASHMYTFTSTTALMLKNGIRLNDCLGLAERTISNIYIKNEIISIQALMVQGMSFSQALNEQTYFDEMLNSVVLTGEESGKMDASLKEISEFYSIELQRSIDNLTEMIQPLAMIAISIVIVPVLIAVYLPIFNLSSASGMI